MEGQYAKSRYNKSFAKRFGICHSSIYIVWLSCVEYDERLGMGTDLVLLYESDQNINEKINNVLREYSKKSYIKTALLCVGAIVSIFCVIGICLLAVQ